MNRESVGARVRRLRLARNIAQRDLANMAGITGTQMFRIEMKNVEPGIFTAIGIAKALHVSLDYMCCLTDEL